MENIEHPYKGLYDEMGKLTRYSIDECRFPRSFIERAIAEGIEYPVRSFRGYNQYLDDLNEEIIQKLLFIVKLKQSEDMTCDPYMYLVNRMKKFTREEYFKAMEYYGRQQNLRLIGIESSLEMIWGTPDSVYFRLISGKIYGKRAVIFNCRHTCKEMTPHWRSGARLATIILKKYPKLHRRLDISPSYVHLLSTQEDFTVNIRIPRTFQEDNDFWRKMEEIEKKRDDRYEHVFHKVQMVVPKIDGKLLKPISWSENTVSSTEGTIHSYTDEKGVSKIFIEEKRFEFEEKRYVVVKEFPLRKLRDIYIGEINGIYFGFERLDTPYHIQGYSIRNIISKLKQDEKLERGSTVSLSDAQGFGWCIKGVKEFLIENKVEVYELIKENHKWEDIPDEIKNKKYSVDDLSFPRGYSPFK